MTEGQTAITALITLRSHAFFLDEWWRNLPGRRKQDRREIEVAVLIWYLGYYNNQYYRPVGASWNTPCTETQWNEYINQYKDVMQYYQEWQLNQR